jgi:hypothetical protein
MWVIHICIFLHHHSLRLLGLIHTASRAKLNQTNLAWKTNLYYEMEEFTLPVELNQTKSDQACSLADVCFLLAS